MIPCSDFLTVQDVVNVVNDQTHTHTADSRFPDLETDSCLSEWKSLFFGGGGGGRG